MHFKCAVLYLVAQSCPTLCDPMACSPPGSSVHGDSPGMSTGVGCHALLQGISSQPRDQTKVSCIASGFFTNEPPGKPIKYISILLCKELHSKWLGDYVLSGSEELLTPNADIVSLTTCVSAIWLIVKCWLQSESYSAVAEWSKPQVVFSSSAFL